MDGEACWLRDGLHVPGGLWVCWRRDSLPCRRKSGGLKRGVLFLIAEELLVVLAGDGGPHEVHPDGQCGAGAGLLFAERFAAVVTHPNAAGDRGREAQKPGVGEVAGGAGFAAEGMVQLRGSRAGAVRGDGAQQRHHGARGFLADDFVDGRRLLPERDAVGIGDFANEARSHANAVVGEDRVGGHLLLERDFDRAQSDGQIWRECSEVTPKRWATSMTL